jgi:hypothetical protein
VRPAWKVENGMITPEEAVELLHKFLGWCAKHEGHKPLRLACVEGGAGVACDQCRAVFVLGQREETDA